MTSLEHYEKSEASCFKKEEYPIISVGTLGWLTQVLMELLLCCALLIDLHHQTCCQDLALVF